MTRYVYVGSFNYQGSEGISICHYNEMTGQLTYIKSVSTDINAGSLLIDGDFLYATDEQREGQIVTFKINPDTGDLTELGRTPTYAVNPASVTLDKTGKYVLVTHFAVGGAVSKVVSDGAGGYRNRTVFNDAPIIVFDRTSNGLPKIRNLYCHEVENKPSFLHKVFAAPVEDLYGICNLGADEINLLSIDSETAAIDIRHTISTPDGQGPRHLVFHESLPYFYCNYEHSKFISAFRYDDEGITHLADTALLDEETELLEGYNHSEIMLSQNGKYLYNFLRGLNKVYVLEIQDDGHLELVQSLDLDSQTPRAAVLSPDYRFVHVASKDSENVEILKVTEEGLLERYALTDKIPHPGAIAYY